jgi:DNA-binding LacI/PurR family transcriptional regulator
MSRSTIKDVAVLARVSQSTVSRALSTPEIVKEETVRRVREAARSLNYVYNATAGSLSSRRTDALGVIIPSSAYSAFAINLMGIQEVCSERNFSCRIAASQFQPEKELLAMRKYHEQRVSGLLMAGIDPSNVPYLRAMIDDGIPAIVLWETPGENFNYIAIDNRRAAYEGGKYLIALGHERIALISGPYTCAQRNVARLEGYKAVLEDHGLHFDEDLVSSQLPTFLDGKEAMRACLRLDNPPTAVLCGNDYLAIGAIRAIHEAGLRVPEDISVCGFDDVDISAYFNPPITTIKTPGQIMGRMAGEAMINAIEKDGPLQTKYMLDAELVVRGTCAVCRRAR